jgi:hypothetical protein
MHATTGGSKEPSQTDGSQLKKPNPRELYLKGWTKARQNRAEQHNTLSPNGQHTTRRHHPGEANSG